MSDLISRQDAIDCATYDVEYTIECLKALPPAQRWIPCEVRLPEYNNYVLATTAWDTITIAERLKPAEVFSGCDWFIHEGATNAENEDILAWMPLPEPWKMPEIEREERNEAKEETTKS